jgi:DNA-binding XRE family transcriptional regulator
MTQPGLSPPGPPPISARNRRWTSALDGGRLRQLRRQRGLSQTQLASQAGISRATMARLERQPVAPCRSRTLSRLATALGEDPAALTIGGPG